MAGGILPRTAGLRRLRAALRPAIDRSLGKCCSAASATLPAERIALAPIPSQLGAGSPQQLAWRCRRSPCRGWHFPASGDDHRRAVPLQHAGVLSPGGCPTTYGEGTMMDGMPGGVRPPPRVEAPAAADHQIRRAHHGRHIVNILPQIHIRMRADLFRQRAGLPASWDNPWIPQHGYDEMGCPRKAPHG